MLKFEKYLWKQDCTFCEIFSKLSSRRKKKERGREMEEFVKLGFRYP